MRRPCCRPQASAVDCCVFFRSVQWRVCAWMPFRARIAAVLSASPALSPNREFSIIVMYLQKSFEDASLEVHELLRGNKTDAALVIATQVAFIR